MHSSSPKLQYTQSFLASLADSLTAVGSSSEATSQLLAILKSSILGHSKLESVENTARQGLYTEMIEWILE